MSNIDKLAILDIYFLKGIFMHVTATELKNKLGQYLEASQREPVSVDKNGRTAYVIVSYHDYQKFLELEDLVWGLKAIEASKTGSLGPEESAALLKQLEARHKHAQD